LAGYDASRNLQATAAAFETTVLAAQNKVEQDTLTLQADKLVGNSTAHTTDKSALTTDSTTLKTDVATFNTAIKLLSTDAQPVV